MQVDQCMCHLCPHTGKWWVCQCARVGSVLGVCEAALIDQSLCHLKRVMGMVFRGQKVPTYRSVDWREKGSWHKEPAPLCE